MATSSQTNSDFMASIKKILSSEKMKNVLTSLLAQVTEA